MKLINLAIFFVSLLDLASAFAPGSRFLVSSFVRSSVIRMSEEPPAAPAAAVAPASKGFGKKTEKVEEEVVKDEGTKKYERDSKRGVPEYNIFMRPANGEKEDWVRDAVHYNQM